jgi:hypothetical protein
MASQPPTASDNSGSAQDLMNEALEKASFELERMVQATIENLTAFSQSLEGTFEAQLQRVVEQSQNIIDSNIDDLVTHREELVEKLAEVERSEMITLTSSAREVRQLVIQRSEAASEAIIKLINEQMTELRMLADFSENRFSPFIEDNAESIKKLTADGQAKIHAEEIEIEKVLTDKVLDLDKVVQEAITDAKKSLEKNLEDHNVEMEKKIDFVLKQLDDVVASTIGDIETTAATGLKSLESANNDGKERLIGTLKQWKEDCTEISVILRENLTAEARTSQKMHSSRLDHKVGEVKDEINQISQNAGTKLVASHKLFSSSLKRLEKKYNDRLDRLLSKFEAALAEEAKLPQSSVQYAQDLRDMLNSKLQARAKDVGKALQRQVDQFESEYTRYSSSSNERIDSIRTAAIESIEKQAKIMAGELERILRSFNTEMQELQQELPQIEEAGRAAALAVMAYRAGARLSLD